MASKTPARPTELKVKVISAKDLIAADSNGKSDPFAVVYTKSGSSGKDKSIKTKKISETLNPTWNETFNLILRDRKDTLVIEVWDDDLFGKDHLGTAELALEGLEHEKESSFIAKLNKKGEVSVALTIKYNDKEIDELKQKQEEEKKRIAAEAQRKKDEDDKRIAAEAQKKKEEDEKKKKEEEQKKAKAAKATPAPVQPTPSQTPAKTTTAPVAPVTTPAKTTTPVTPTTTTTTTTASQSNTSQTKSTTSSSSSTSTKPGVKQAEEQVPNYALIGGVVAVVAIAGFAAFKYFQKN